MSISDCGCYERMYGTSRVVNSRDVEVRKISFDIQEPLSQRIQTCHIQKPAP